MNLTKLNKPVVRGTEIKIGSSTLTVGFLPPGTLSMKLKGERKTRYIDLKQLWMKEAKDVQVQAPVVKAKPTMTQPDITKDENAKAFLALAEGLDNSLIMAVAKALVEQRKTPPVPPARKIGSPRVKMNQPLVGATN